MLCDAYCSAYAAWSSTCSPIVLCADLPDKSDRDERESSAEAEGDQEMSQVCKEVLTVP